MAIHVERRRRPCKSLKFSQRSFGFLGEQSSFLPLKHPAQL
jgi:hypothetical protein